MIKVNTKNCVQLYISMTEDCFPNEGGYYCEVYRDEDGMEEFDNFVIHKEDLDCFANKKEGIEELCRAYAEGVDDMPILNKKFNAIYDRIGDLDNDIDNFYTCHILFNKNVDANSDIFSQMSKLQMMISEVKCLAHSIAEHYTWDD